MDGVTLILKCQDGDVPWQLKRHIFLDNFELIQQNPASSDFQIELKDFRQSDIRTFQTIFRNYSVDGNFENKGCDLDTMDKISTILKCQNFKQFIQMKLEQDGNNSSIFCKMSKKGYIGNEKDENQIAIHFKSEEISKLMKLSQERIFRIIPKIIKYNENMKKDLINAIIQQILYVNQKCFLKILILFNYSELKQNIKKEELKKIIELSDTLFLKNVIKNELDEQRKQTKQLDKTNHSLIKTLETSLKDQKEINDNFRNQILILEERIQNIQKENIEQVNSLQAINQKYMNERKKELEQQNIRQTQLNELVQNINDRVKEQLNKQEQLIKQTVQLEGEKKQLIKQITEQTEQLKEQKALNERIQNTRKLERLIESTKISEINITKNISIKINENSNNKNLNYYILSSILKSEKINRKLRMILANEFLYNEKDEFVKQLAQIRFFFDNHSNLSVSLSCEKSINILNTLMQKNDSLINEDSLNMSINTRYIPKIENNQIILKIENEDDIIIIAINEHYVLCVIDDIKLNCIKLMLNDANYKFDLILKKDCLYISSDEIDISYVNIRVIYININ